MPIWGLSTESMKPWPPPGCGRGCGTKQATEMVRGYGVTTRTDWPVRGFPATQRETRGSPALCVSGSFQGNQRVFGAPFCFSRVSLGKLASFPESESWSGAKSGAKLRKSARYPGIFQVYRGFPGIPAKYPVFCRFWPQNSLRHGSEPPQNDEFHGVSPGFPEETRGCCRETSRKHGKETR